MNGYIKKQALMDYCSNQVTRTIDLNDIARFPIAEVFTKHEVIAMLTELYMEIEELDNPLDYDFEGYDTCVVDCEKLIQQKIDKLKENTNDTNTD